MKKTGFMMMAAALLGWCAGAAEPADAPDVAQWSVVKLVQVGRDAMAKGDRTKARALAEAAVARDSGYADGWKLLGTLRLQAGETNEASQAFRTALLIAPRDPVINRELAWLLWSEDREKALASLDVLVESNVPDRDVVIRRVLSQLADGGSEAQALELYKRWKPAYSLSELGVSLYAGGRRLAAVPFLEAAWEAGENRSAVGLYLAQIESRRGKTSRVAECLKAALDTLPAAVSDEQSGLIWEGVLSLKAGSVSDDLWKQIEARYPTAQDKRVELADRFEKAAVTARRRSDGATTLLFYRQTLMLDPNRMAWADWHLAEERLLPVAVARTNLNALLARVSAPAIRDGITARIAHFQGDLEAAVQGYRKSLALLPDQLVLRVFLVRDLLASSKLEDARHELKLIEAQGRDDSGRTQRDLAEFWLEVGDVPRSVALDPTLLTRKAKSLLAENELEAAYTMAALAITNDAGNAEAWLQYGVVQGRRQQQAESKWALEKALSLKPDSVNAHQELGWTLWALGEKAPAVEAWSKALGLGIPDRERFVRQVVGRMAEEGQKELALGQHVKWLPDTTPLATGLDFFRSGRKKAAEIFLSRAWETGAERALTGFYLGAARAANGVVAGTPDYFSPYITSCVATASPVEVAQVTDALRICSVIPGSEKMLDALAVAVSNRPDLVAKVTDVYFSYGRDEAERGNFAKAIGLYEKALNRDPNRLNWIVAWNLTDRLQDVECGARLLSNLQARATAVAVRSGVAGKVAEQQGGYERAIAAYQASLDAEPAQVEIRKALFDCCLEIGDFERGRREVEWMEQQVEERRVPLRDMLAIMWTGLGEDQKALEVWQFMHLAMPQVPYYASELAMAQYRTGKGTAAVETLIRQLRSHPSTLGYEMLTQLLTALGRNVEAVEKAREGLRFANSVALRRNLAENLELVEPVGSTTTVVAARATLADEPGAVLPSLLLARALAASGQTEEAMSRHQEMLSRNPVFVPSLVFLRDQEIVAERPRHALPYAERLATSRPWDDMALRRYAMTLAEADGFSRAIRIMGPLARRDDKAVTALLLYADTTVYDYPGRNTAAQISAHIASLVSNGYTFVTSLPAPEGLGKTVMMVLVQPDRAVVEAVDAALQTHKAAAVMVVNPRGLKHALPRMTSPQRMAELRQTGRWQIGVTLPELGRAVVRADGVKGNPLTHRILVKGEQETLDAMAERVSDLLAAVAGGLGDGKERWLYYPGGDYGQLSLDAEPAVMAALSNAVAKSFTMALCRDDNGFITGNMDPLRLPAKVVPPSWTAAALEDHILRGNSVVRAQLELAKLLYWHGQSDAASHWFRKAAEAGANPYEVTYNLAANAAVMGDLAQTLEKSREALSLAPAGDMRSLALMEKALNMRRPTLTLDAAGWWDNEDRSYWKAGVDGEGPLKDWLRWQAGVAQHNWEQKGQGDEQATSVDLGFLAYVAPEVWVEAGLQEWLMDSLPDEIGWRARLRLPNHRLRGFVNFISRMEMMETVEALRAEITSHREGVETYSRLLDFWDCFADLSLTQRSDGNDTWWGSVRLIRRLKETPYLGIGYAGRYADSTTDAPEYWSPEELQQHQIYAAIHRTGVKWGVQLSGQSGYAQERDTDWRYVFGGKVTGVYRLTPTLSLGGDLQYQEGPIYNRTTAEAYLKARW